VSRETPGSATAPGRIAYSWISARHLPAVAAQLPLHSVLFAVCARGRHSLWRSEGELAGDPPARSLSSVSPRGLRSRPLMR
jgi:hypothetical protein